MDPEGPVDCFCLLDSLSADGSATWNRLPDMGECPIHLVPLILC